MSLSSWFVIILPIHLYSVCISRPYSHVPTSLPPSTPLPQTQTQTDIDTDKNIHIDNKTNWKRATLSITGQNLTEWWIFWSIPERTWIPVLLLTWSNHFVYICSEFLSHETKYAENDKSREETCATIDTAYNDGIPKREETRKISVDENKTINVKKTTGLRERENKWIQQYIELTFGSYY